MIIESRKWIGGHEIKTGARIPVASNHSEIRFAIYAVCEDAGQPERWHGEVLLAGRPVLTTAQVATHDEAGRLAERGLVDRLVELLSASVPVS
ncbi:hypothetical protein [Nocardioides caldifontis]|uniref:hypothetical protein n=1 Tax=Nocardioides caldifontis TaxID=2588938 RepID=UPI0011DFF63D|nr:hypothetical protein [Nocardioides caldifontis]